jgi:hypothetical protein
MAHFLVEISYLHPYPIKKEFRVEASSVGPAVNRGIRHWRKENAKGLKIKTITIKATKI